MNDLTCDVAIIGAGTAALAAERAARKAGANTLLIDDRFAGTTCQRRMHALEASYRRGACRIQCAQGFDVRYGNEDIRGRPRRHGSRAQRARQVRRRNAEVDREDTRRHLRQAAGRFFGQDYARAR
jgi:dihydrolipoamide dehydrogenase